jgi:hypothetical protein
LVVVEAVQVQQEVLDQPFQLVELEIHQQLVAILYFIQEVVEVQQDLVKETLVLVEMEAEDLELQLLEQLVVVDQ